ncbi:hypothetical protein IV203_028114 [Nitzschia inconspicua]|uniref:Uncharacterized protein n=1 Tax=Nitzschia inconspicua TaxID=303405 RepID=A0A9K3LYI3_9STRA|nr:hypothetical protein IV203_028114 [Nitzschia inconspicua]
MASTPPSKHCCYRDVPSFPGRTVESSSSSMGERSNFVNQEPRPSPVYVARDWPERSPFASPIRTMMDVSHEGLGGSPDGKGDGDGDNTMMLKHHQALFSSSFDTISDAGQPQPQPLTHPRHHPNNGDSNNSSFFDATTVSLLDHTMMMLESPMAQKPADRRNSMVIQPRSQYQDLLVQESGLLQRNSESREEEQQDGRLMMEHDTDETHRSSSDDDEKPMTRSSNRKSNNLYSPPPKVVHRKDPLPAAPDISPIALDVFRSNVGKRQAQQTRDGTATQMLRHATSPSSIDQQPNEVSFLKSESSSTGAEDLDKSYDTTQSTAAIRRNNYPDGEQGNYEPNSHSYPPHYETNGPDVAPNFHRNHHHHLHHPLPQPNTSKYHSNHAIQSSPVIARRRHGPPMLPYWSQYPYQRSNAGHPDDAQHYYPPSYHPNDAQQHYPPSYYYQHASHHDRNRRHTITESNRNHPPYTSTALAAPSSHHHPSTSSPSSSILQHAEYYPNNPIYILRSVRKAFKGCTYLLHCVQSSQSVCPVTIHQAHMGIVEYHDRQMVDPTPEDLTIAIRRVESAIFAFGGYVHTSSSSGSDSGGKNAKKSKTSIFRRLSTRQGTSLQSSNETYHGKFHQRYCIKGHGISWEIEENPPIEISDDTTHSNGKKSGQKKRAHISKANIDAWNGENGLETSMEASFDDDEQAPASPSSTSPSYDGDDSFLADRNKKMKYRCKLCGKPKQNHSCPYRSSLQRSIGISVVPVVNGYTAEEPGVLTVALSEMNNFVSYVGSNVETTALEVQDEEDDDDDATSQRSTRRKKVPPPVQVTPVEGGGGGTSNKNNKMLHQDSPQNSSLSSVPTPGRRRRPTPSSLHRVARKRTLNSTCQERGQKRSTNTVATAAATTTSMTTTAKTIIPRRPRLFAEPLLLRPEHYRAVSHSKKGRGGVVGRVHEISDDPHAFEYVPIPVSFQGRKRLSDTLFYLSKSLPSITAEVATLLRTAREGDEWDLAVAQLLTQVIVALYCVEGDHQLDGLRRYLLNIGIAT